MKYRGYYSLTLVSETGSVAKTDRMAEYEVDEFEHPGRQLRRIALSDMEKFSALGVSINEFDRIDN